LRLKFFPLDQVPYSTGTVAVLFDDRIPALPDPNTNGEAGTYPTYATAGAVELLLVLVIVQLALEAEILQHQKMTVVNIMKDRHKLMPASKHGELL
jgi:hypothetical protein